jgi:hypothetical protein
MSAQCRQAAPRPLSAGSHSGGNAPQRDEPPQRGRSQRIPAPGGRGKPGTDSLGFSQAVDVLCQT